MHGIVSDLLSRHMGGGRMHHGAPPESLTNAVECLRDLVLHNPNTNHADNDSSNSSTALVRSPPPLSSCGLG